MNTNDSNWYGVQSILKMVEYTSLFNQIADYLNERVSADDSPELLCFVSDKEHIRYNMAIRNSVALLMEEASDKVKEQIREEFDNV
jgi:hypothetical protein